MTLAHRTILSFLLCCSLLPLPVPAQEKIDASINAKIRAEEAANSQIMHTMHYLTDVYGPRLTGSPNHKAAAEWALKEMTKWGFSNAHLEPWDFGHPGWTNDRLTAHIVSPVKDALVLEALAWTPGTNGAVTAQAVQIIPPGLYAPPQAGRGGRGGRGGPDPAAAPAPPRVPRPSEEEVAKYLDALKDKVKGKMVLVGEIIKVPFEETPPAKRRDDASVKESYDPNNPNAGAFGRGGRGGPQEPQPGLTPAQVSTKVDEFLIANGASVRINDAGREHGQIRAFNNRTFDASKAPPTVVMRNEDYGRIARILADGTPVSLEFDIKNTWYPEGKTTYNTIAEITGTDKKDEVVMLGGHLDSWHSATGATDNAIGCAVMMEAARILKAIGVKPRRTIRVALWAGEEEGLLGSKAYVAQHYGTAENPKPEFAKFDGYFNVDSGTGRVRGGSIFGPPEAAKILRESLAPFEDLGVFGASVSKSRMTGGTDSTSFNYAGLPGIGMSQDPMEYNSHTWHTNLDTYERIVESDVKTSAIVIAGALYQLAMRDQMIPRFPKEEMPPLPPPPANP